MKNKTLDHIMRKFNNGDFNFQAMSWNNASTKHWYTERNAGVDVWPLNLFVSVWVQTPAGRKDYTVFRYGKLKRLFDHLSELGKNEKRKSLIAWEKWSNEN